MALHLPQHSARITAPVDVALVQRPRVPGRRAHLLEDLELENRRQKVLYVLLKQAGRVLN